MPRRFCQIINTSAMGTPLAPRDALPSHLTFAHPAVSAPQLIWYSHTQCAAAQQGSSTKNVSGATQKPRTRSIVRRA
jgi:hypothetical protein